VHTVLHSFPVISLFHLVSRTPCWYGLPWTSSFAHTARSLDPFPPQLWNPGDSRCSTRCLPPKDIVCITLPIPSPRASSYFDHTYTQASSVLSPPSSFFVSVSSLSLNFPTPDVPIPWNFHTLECSNELILKSVSRVGCVWGVHGVMKDELRRGQVTDSWCLKQAAVNGEPCA
jgi:hypothetical protein